MEDAEDEIFADPSLGFAAIGWRCAAHVEHSETAKELQRSWHPPASDCIVRLSQENILFLAGRAHETRQSFPIRSLRHCGDCSQKPGRGGRMPNRGPVLPGLINVASKKFLIRTESLLTHPLLDFLDTLRCGQIDLLPF